MADDDPTWDPDVVAKFERAQTLQRELAETQAKLRDDVKFEYDWVNNFNESTDPMAWQEWRLRGAPPRPDLAFAAVFGDLVHNLRASLDYCAWGAASEQARSSNPTQVFFPLHAKQRDWTKWRKDRGSWYSPAVVEVFEDSQLFHAPPDQLHPLAILQVLSNTDKHRLLNTARYGFVSHDLTLDPPPAAYTFDAVDLVPEAAGSVVARLEMPRPLGGGSVDVHVEFGWYECFKYEPRVGPAKWLMVSEMVDAMYAMTLSTIARMQAAITASA